MDKLINYTTDERPWGSFIQFTKDEPTTVKIITVKAGEAFSLQTHKHRDEFWCVVSGAGTAHIGGEERQVDVGDEMFIPRETVHRMTGGPEGISFLEIAFGEFDEEDIIRIEDRYGRM